MLWAWEERVRLSPGSPTRDSLSRCGCWPSFACTFFAIRSARFRPGPVAVSPADGKVVAVKAEGPALQRISIFLNVFDVHVNRTPIGGTICKVQYQKGPIPRGEP